MKIVVVESPAKAKTINKYLGKDYEVLASFGHVRDLPAKDGSVDPEADFRMLWEVDAKSQKRLADIARALKGADSLILATDPDREGEAISWHVLEVLRQKRALTTQKVERVVFNAITKQSVTEAMRAPREIDSALVDAYLARRALDYLVGFTLSPVLWRKLPGARSAGRVQSVALRLVCDREMEIDRFVAQEYWSLVARLATPRDEVFEARLVGADGKRIQRLDIGSGADAEAFRQALDSASFAVTSVEAKPGRRHPPPPFTTSTLQQEASRKLGLAPAQTMRLAQRLYEGIDIGGETQGLITYMRTDGVQMAEEAITAARKVISANYGARYLPSAPRRYQTKAKNAQEAHEAIRPTELSRHPREAAKFLERDQARLYELIWLRAMASQMESAELERTTVDIAASASGGIGRYKALDLRATGTVIKFDGFLTLYQESRDEPDEDEESRRLPAMSAGEALDKRGIDASQHFTEPPPRYSEASLVKRMEELGIGRPSTYASILQVLQDRAYVRLDKRRLYAEDKGRLVTAFMESFFARYVEYDFTASLEEQLDRVSNAEVDWRQILRDFWRDFTGALDEIKDLRIGAVLDALDAMLGPHVFPARDDGVDPRLCPTCGTGRLSIKIGRFGAFVGCSNYPECRHTRTFSASAEGAESGSRVLGQDPETGLDVSVRSGRFGPYLQLGEGGDGEKPKRSSLPKGVTPDSIELEQALALLSLPRAIGTHPEDGEPILAGIGRFGPYVQHGRTYANLDRDDDVLSIGLNRAVALIADKATKGGRGRGNADPGRPLGDHPQKGGPVVVKKGRYGPYASHDGVNATLPGDKTPETVTLEEAVALIDARAAAGGGRKGARRAPARKAPAKKAPSKKAAPKKATGKTTTSTTATSKTAAVDGPAAAKAATKAPAKKAPAKKKTSAKKTSTKSVPAKKSAGSDGAAEGAATVDLAAKRAAAGKTAPKAAGKSVPLEPTAAPAGGKRKAAP